MPEQASQLWKSSSDLVLPIDENQFSRFRSWVDYNSFKNPDNYHTGWDFAAYLSDNGDCLLGLQSNLEVRAISGGIVTEIVKSNQFHHYNDQVEIQHGPERDRKFSGYAHLLPLVNVGDKVQTGQTIGRLVHANSYGKDIHLIHLHLELFNIIDYSCKDIDGFDYHGKKKIFTNPAEILFSNQKLPSWKDYQNIAIITQKTLSKESYAL